MILRILNFGLVALGVAALFIGAGMFVFGPAALTAFFVAGMGMIFDMPKTGEWSINADNELRFYAVFWIGFGFLLIDSVRNLDGFARRHLNILVGIFFLGGVGRAVSILNVGMPHPMFVHLMIMEFVLPVIFWVLIFLTHKKNHM